MNKSRQLTSKKYIEFKDKVPLGIVLPTNSPETLDKLFLRGVHNLDEIKDLSVILINFQPPYTESLAKKAVKFLTDQGFRVNYSLNTYDISEGVPFNEIVHDTAMLGKYNNLAVYLRMDDDILPGGVSPVIGKSCGQQYLEILYYMMSHPECGVVCTGGTISKHPARHFLGPSTRFTYPKYHPREKVKEWHPYIQTGLGLFARNIDNYILPKDTIYLLGALEDLLIGGYRLVNGYYVAKYTSVRATHHVRTKSLSKEQGIEDLHPNRWEENSVLESNVVKYVRDNWNPNFDYKSISQIMLSYDDYICLTNANSEIANSSPYNIIDKDIVEYLTSDFTNYNAVNNYKDIVSDILEYYEDYHSYPSELI